MDFAPNKIIEKRPNGTTRVATQPLGETKAQQQFKDECDVNNIMAKYKKTGTVTHIRNSQMGVYADLTNLPDLQQAQAVVIAAQEAFAEVPAQIRQRFGHDPQQFIEFLSDPKNEEEAIKLGLRTRPKPPEPNPILDELKDLNKNLKPKSSKKSTSSEE